MSFNKGELEAAFQAEVADFQPLPCGFGLRVGFKDKADLNRLLSYDTNNWAYSCPDVFALAQRAGLIVLDNSHLDLPSMISITKNIHQGRLKQDFFHWDTPFHGQASMFYNPQGQDRAAPVVYARVEEVRKALRDLDVASVRIDEESLENLRKARENSFGFSLRGEDANVRDGLVRISPDFTQWVIDRIPEEKKFVHFWRPEGNVVLVHYNVPECGILHARPESNDHQNLIKSLTFE